MRILIAALVTVCAAAPAGADDGRGGMTGGILVGGGPAQVGDRSGGGVTMAAHLGWLVAATGGRLGVEAELIGGEAWFGGSPRVDGVLIGALRVSPTDRVWITLGLGVAAADNGADTDAFVAGGAAAAASLSVDLRRWRRAALAAQALGYGGRFDDGTAYHLAIGLAVAWYGLTTPPR